VTIPQQSPDRTEAVGVLPRQGAAASSPLHQAVRAVALGWLLLWAILQPRFVCAATLVEGPTVEIISATNVVIRWSTDVATGARVRYGTALSQLAQGAQDDVRSKHSVTLKSLRPGTKYFYTVGTARLPLATNSFSTPGQRPAIAPTAIAKPASQSGGIAPATARRAPPTRETWGAIGSLRDHFERHGGDFRAKDADDYARQAWEFLQRARAEGLPTKVDEDGVIRIFDPKTRTFAAYNRDGTTKTFFKPDSRDYFDRQPGRSANPKDLPF